jgi:hypothetical protein
MNPTLLHEISHQDHETALAHQPLLAELSPADLKQSITCLLPPE